MSITSTERECISIERINQYLHNSKEEIKEKRKIKDSSLYEAPILYNESNDQKVENVAVEFKNVWLKYDPKSNNYSLKNISFQIKTNQKIAFCGRTGCGKTSILNCLFRLYEIEKGGIFFMGKNINSLSLHELRSKIVYFNKKII